MLGQVTCTLNVFTIYCRLRKCCSANAQRPLITGQCSRPLLPHYIVGPTQGNLYGESIVFSPTNWLLEATGSRGSGVCAGRAAPAGLMTCTCVFRPHVSGLLSLQRVVHVAMTYAIEGQLMHACCAAYRFLLQGSCTAGAAGECFVRDKCSCTATSKNLPLDAQQAE